VSQQKANTSLMYMCTPTDVYAVPAEVIEASKEKYAERSKAQTLISKSVATLSRQHFFQKNSHELIQSGDQAYGICDCLVVEQGPNYALAKRIQQWRATLDRKSTRVNSSHVKVS